jgi:hypothetical protein
MDPQLATFFTALAGGLGLLCLWRSHHANRRFRLIEALPTSRTQGVFIGLVELKGTAEGQAFTSFLTEQPCVLYNWSVQEEWRRRVVETYRDQQGRTQTRTRVESGWSTVDSGGESAPFYLQDETGSVLIHPDGADVRPFSLFSDQVTARDPLYYGKGPAAGIMDSTGVRRFTEQGIPLHSEIFIVGQARERQDIVAAEIANAPGVPLYLLTSEKEAQVLKRYGRSRDWLGVLGFILAGTCGYGVAFLTDYPPALGVGAAAGLYLLAWLVTWVWMLFNSLVDVRNRVRQGWSLIEVQLKRRHDLIPPLVRAVEGLKLHEQTVQETLAELRAQQEATPPGQAGPDYHAAAAQIHVLAESWPVLKSSEAFLSLQRSLTETEQRIALARDYFNDITTAYNTRLEVFPDSMLAKMFGFVPQPLLMAEDFERAVVPLNLTPTPHQETVPPPDAAAESSPGTPS